MKKVKGVYVSQSCLVAAGHMFIGSILSHYKGSIVLSTENSVIETDVIIFNCQNADQILEVIEKELQKSVEALGETENKKYQNHLKINFKFFSDLKKKLKTKSLLKEPQDELIEKLYESGLSKKKNSEYTILISGVSSQSNK